jgi:hypothetical protein
MSESFMLRNVESFVSDVAEVSLMRGGPNLAFHSDTKFTNAEDGFARTVDVDGAVTGKDPVVGTFQIHGIHQDKGSDVFDVFSQLRDKSNQIVMSNHLRTWDEPGPGSDQTTQKVVSMYKGILDVTVESSCVRTKDNADATTCDETVKDKTGQVIGTLHIGPSPVDELKESGQSEVYDAAGKYVGTVKHAVERSQDGRTGSMIIDVVHDDQRPLRPLVNDK